MATTPIKMRGYKKPAPTPDDHGYSAVALWVEGVARAREAVQEGGGQGLDYERMALLTTRATYGAVRGADDCPVWRAMDATRRANILLARAAWRRGRMGGRDLGLWWAVASGALGVREAARRAGIDHALVVRIVADCWAAMEEVLWEAGEV